MHVHGDDTVWGRHSKGKSYHSEGPPIANPNPNTNPTPQRTFAIAAHRYGGPTPTIHISSINLHQELQSRCQITVW